VTACRWFGDGKLPGAAHVHRVGGLILVDRPAAAGPAGISAVYARVSSAGQRADLDRQVARKEAQLRLARVQGRAANIRSDARHKATTRLAKNHGAVVIEDLAPRQHMRGLRSHRKSWADAAAGEMRRQLTCKARWYDADLWVAGKWYPSSKTAQRQDAGRSTRT
jgi:IS605 OrfB family transposase